MATSSTTVTTPESHGREATSANGAGAAIAQMTVEEAMDMDIKSESEDETMGNVYGTGNDDEEDPSFGPKMTNSLPFEDPTMSPDPMDLLATTDSRQRPPMEDGWGPDKITFVGIKNGCEAWS